MDAGPFDGAPVSAPDRTDDMVQDDSDFYSESGSPEKNQQTAQLQADADDGGQNIAPLHLPKHTSTSPSTEQPSHGFSAFPGLGVPDAQPPFAETNPNVSSPNDSSSEDLYGVEDAAGENMAAEVATAGHTVDEDLGFTPEHVSSNTPENGIVVEESVVLEVPLSHQSSDESQQTQVESTTEDIVQAGQDHHLPVNGEPGDLVTQGHVQLMNGDATNGDNTTDGAEKTLAQADPEFMAAAEENKSSADAEWRFDASDAESSSSNSSAASSSEESGEDGSEDEGVLLDPAEQARILMQESGGDDQAATEEPLRTANEQPEQFVKKPDIALTADMKIGPLGQVDQIVNNLAVIEAKTSGEYRVLEAGSALCLEDRIVIGAISETLGRVQAPRYTVGFSSAQELEESGLQKGTMVYFVEDYSTFVFTQPLRLAKGTDASNLHDEEIAVEELEFSDDEKEAEYKRAAKQAKRDAKEAREADTMPEVQETKEASDGFLKQPPTGPKNKNRPAQRGAQPAHQNMRKSHPDSDVNGGYPGAISYDDDEDEDMYRPLKRPDNLHEMMASGPPVASTLR